MSGCIPLTYQIFTTVPPKSRITRSPHPSSSLTLSHLQWKEAVATGQVKPAPQNPTPAAAGQAMSLTTAFNFDQAPELMNGRLAMLAFVAALGAELSSGESVLRQFADTPTAVIFTAVTFTAASLIPMLSGVKRESFGPFTPGAEMTNGRAAMLGFAALILVEVVRGKALF
jgi:hypothetical protein